MEIAYTFGLVLIGVIMFVLVSNMILKDRTAID